MNYPLRLLNAGVVVYLFSMYASYYGGWAVTYAIGSFVAVIAVLWMVVILQRLVGFSLNHRYHRYEISERKPSRKRVFWYYLIAHLYGVLNFRFDFSNKYSFEKYYKKFPFDT